MPENHLALKIYNDGELIGYEALFKIRDWEFTEQEFDKLLTKLRIIKSAVIETIKNKSKDGK